MSLRIKLALSMALLVAAATVAAGWVGHALTADALRDEVDASLRAASSRLEGGRGQPLGALLLERAFERIGVQFLDASGAVLSDGAGTPFPVDAVDRGIAAGEAPAVLRTVSVDAVPYRVLTVPTEVRGDRRRLGSEITALQFTRSLAETESVLGTIGSATAVLVVLVSAAAAALGLILAQRITAPIRSLASTATSVAESGRLDIPVPVAGDRETADLGRALRSMLDALGRSRRAQQQLVQDAGHELRTPLTSLRTNVEVMQRFAELSPEQRTDVLRDIESESLELSSLVDELVMLASDEASEEPVEVAVIVDIVDRAVQRARRRSGRTIELHGDQSRAAVRRNEVERAVNNLLSNAIKFSGGVIEVTVSDAMVAVADHGPGFGDMDPLHAFERFHRADSARALPGSGLGLAIVAQVAARHGGEVFARDRGIAEGGPGAVVGFRLPGVDDGPSSAL